MSHTLLDSISEEDGENLLPSELEANPLKVAKALSRDINSLVTQLEQVPTERTTLDQFSKEGELLKQTSKSQHCELVWAEVRSDILSFYTGNGGDHVQSHRICWVYSREVSREDSISLASGNRSAWRVTIFSRGHVLLLAFDADETAKSWVKFFKRLMKAKYSEEERQEKSAIVEELFPLLLEQERLKAKQFQNIMNALSESGFFIEPRHKKETEGYLELRVAKRQWKKVYCALFDDFFYMYPPHEKVSLNSEPYDWIQVNFINSIRPSKVPNTIVIRTLLNRFTFKAKHEQAVAQWINAIRSIRERQTGAILPKIETHADDRGYFYSRDIDGKVSLTFVLEGKVKTKKLPKGKEAGIGRSSNNTICIPDDKFISRAHAKVIVEHNVPYCVDLGSSAGTKVNGKRITKEPLKPGDIIEVGKTELTVEVKHGEEIFATTAKPDSSSPAIERKKKKKKRSEEEDSTEAVALDH
jgi:hypothetical protein